MQLFQQSAKIHLKSTNAAERPWRNPTAAANGGVDQAARSNAMRARHVSLMQALAKDCGTDRRRKRS